MELEVKDMTCGHCAGVITKAVKEVDAQAKVDIEVPPKTVRVDSLQDLLAYWTTHIMISKADTPTTLPPQVISLQSRYDFQTTISRLKDAHGARDITVFAEIDQRAAAEHAGTTLRPTRLILFGNPTAGTPVMAADPHTALELPLRAVVWEDDRHAVHLDYQDVTVTLAQYCVAPALVTPLKQMPMLLRQVVGQG